MTPPRPHTESELIDLVRAIDEPAPAALHASVSALIDARPERRPGASAWLAAAFPSARSRGLAGALVACVAAVAIAIAASGGGGTTQSPVTAATALTERAATLAAPTESVADRSQLSANVDGVAFPYWEESFGWRSIGSRVDSLGGRPVRTVFYDNGHGQRVGYAIVGGTPPLHVAGGNVVWHADHPYTVLQVGGATVVAWMRSGRLCVLAGHGVDPHTLLALASWHDGPSAA